MATETFYLPPGAQPPVSPYDHHHSHSQSRSASSSPTYENSHFASPLLPKDEHDWSPVDCPTYYFPDGVPNAASANAFPSQSEKHSSWPRLDRMHKRVQTLRRAMTVLELILFAWTTYTVVRYFLAYTISSSTTGQNIAVVLGGVSTLAVPLILSANIVRTFERPFLAQDVSLSSLLNTATVLMVLSALCLVGPAVTSFVFLFLWRSDVEDSLAISRKCHFDIDVVWQTSSSCTSSPWGVWLGLGIVRLVLTIGILTIYFIFSHSYNRLRRSTSPNSKSYGPSYHYNRARLRSQGSDRTAVAPSPPRSPSAVLPSPEHSSPRRALRDHQSTPSSSTVNTRHTIRTVTNSSGHHTSHSNTWSDDMSSAHTLTDAWQQQQQFSNAPQEVDAGSFSDRFRSLVSQVDEAIMYAQSPEPPESEPEDIYTALPPRSFHAPAWSYSIGYDEHGLPYPPDEHIPMLNGFVRRMPTIESFGSREFGGTSIASSMYGYDTTGTRHSRPPTQLTVRSLFSDRSSEPPLSRGNSWHLNLVPMGNDEDQSGEPSPASSGPAGSFVTAGTGSSVYYDESPRRSGSS